MNWSLSGAAGNFNPDTAPAGFYTDRDFLGVGLNAAPNYAFDNFTHEVNAYLRLTAGNYRMLVNSDDGFEVSVAPGLGNPEGTVLGGFFSGSHPPSDVSVDFVVAADGDYPFRLLWVQPNYETNLLVKWLTHLVFGFGERGSSSGSGARIPP